MSYDFTVTNLALERAAAHTGWADRKSAQLEQDHLIPLARHTHRAENLAEDIFAFILDMEKQVQKITDHYESGGTNHAP